jgi:hypothetical protein
MELYRGRPDQRHIGDNLSQIDTPPHALKKCPVGGVDADRDAFHAGESFQLVFIERPRKI